MQYITRDRPVEDFVAFIFRSDKTKGKMESKYILGVDGGGTKTTVNIADLDGKVLSGCITGSSNYKSIGKEAAKENINCAVFGAMGKLGEKDCRGIKSSCFGIAGNDTKYDLEIYKKIIFNEKLKVFLDPSRTMICNDARIGLEAGSIRENRIMVICGTGSNCFGLNQHGKEARTGGWDYILGDEGSGYSIAVKALKAVMKAYDGRITKTILSNEILKYLELRSEIDIVEWVYKEGMTKEKIADIANAVCRAAELGDNISRNIFASEANEVEAAISVVADKLDIKGKDFDLVIVGSVFKCEKYFKQVLFDNLKKKFDGISFKKLTKKPVFGAISLARKLSKNRGESI